MHAIYSCSWAHLGHFTHTCVSLFWYMRGYVTVCVSLDIDRCIHIWFAIPDQFIHICIWTWFPDTSGLYPHISECLWSHAPGSLYLCILTCTHLSEIIHSYLDRFSLYTHLDYSTSGSPNRNTSGLVCPLASESLSPYTSGFLSFMYLGESSCFLTSGLHYPHITKYLHTSVWLYWNICLYYYGPHIWVAHLVILFFKQSFI